MMIDREKAAEEAALSTARRMVAAAVTAPKGHGIDNIEAVILTGSDKDVLAGHMRDMARETGMDFFERDAGNVELSQCIVLLAARNRPIGLDHCGYCGFKDCRASMDAGGNCAFNVVDLGIAAGSAASVAADCRVDSRIIYTAGKASARMDLFGSSFRVRLGIPLSVTSKSIFFDRDPGAVLIG